MIWPICFQSDYIIKHVDATTVLGLNLQNLPAETAVLNTGLGNGVSPGARFTNMV